jgi:hypothetical protein
MDFGAGEFRDAPKTGRPQGTPLYLAPELVTGGSATIQSDIYALGVLLYYLVTGGFPVEGRSLSDLALAHAQRTRRHLRDARPELPDSFVSIVERAIDPDPARRFQSAGDLHASLEERDTTTQTPVVVRPEPSAPPAPNPQLPLVYIVVSAIAVLASVELCGLVATRTFEVVLSIGQDFSGGMAEYAAIGMQALLPFVLYWLLGIALVSVLTGVRLVLGSRLHRLLGAWPRRFDRISPATIATVIPMLAAACWLVASWIHWPIVDTLAAIHLGAPAGSTNSPILGEAFSRMQYNYSQFSAVLSFGIVFAVWRWWPSLERRSDDLVTVRRMKWTSIALAVVIILAAVAPRRFAMERFEAVTYKNHPSYVIGMRGDDLLLYVADSADTVRPVVRRSDPDLVETHKRLTLGGR